MYTIMVYLDGVAQLGLHRRPELDTKNPPGQIRNDITLGDYVARKQEFMREEAKKLSFEEWAKKQGFLTKDGYWNLANNQEHVLKECWNAAQRNK